MVYHAQNGRKYRNMGRNANMIGMNDTGIFAKFWQTGVTVLFGALTHGR